MDARQRFVVDPVQKKKRDAGHNHRVSIAGIGCCFPASHLSISSRLAPLLGTMFACCVDESSMLLGWDVYALPVGSLSEVHLERAWEVMQRFEIILRMDNLAEDYVQV